MRSSEAIIQALGNDDLLNCILDSIVDRCLSDDCANSLHSQPKKDADDPCIHDQMLARFLSVSKQWFRLAAPYHWREADMNQLSVLVEASRENGVRLIGLLLSDVRNELTLFWGSFSSM
jgi:hypothetical protein